MAFLTQAANRGSISTGYDIENSAVLSDAVRTSTGTGTISYLHFSPSSTGNRKTATFSGWVKRTDIGNVDCIWSAGHNEQHFRFQDSINITNYNDSPTQLNSNALYRDTSAWYHVVMAVDTTQGTAADRLKLYVNGVQVTSFGTESYPTQNSDWSMNYSSDKMYIGARAWYQATETMIQGLDGYMAEIHWIDGQALAPTEFGEFDADSGIWKPKEADVTYGTNGCYLKFDNAANMGEDSSGNSNNWSLNNIAAADQATDTPTNNFSTLNPLMGANLIPEYYTVTQGGTNQVSSKAGYGCSVGTIGVSKGKWYYEVKFDSNFNYGQIGIIDTASLNDTNMNLSPGQTSYGIGWFSGNGGINKDGSYDGSAAYQNFPSYDHNDTIGCAFDLDNNKLYFHKGGTYGNSGDPTSGATGTGAIDLSTAGDGTWHISTNAYYGYAQTNQGGYTTATPSSAASDANGYGTFEYAPPTGYYAICTKNLAEFG